MLAEKLVDAACRLTPIIAAEEPVPGLPATMVMLRTVLPEIVGVDVSV